MLVFSIILIILLVGLIAIACAPTSEISTVNSNLEPAVHGNMQLVGQQQDIQIWSVVDGITGTTCYVTINTQEYHTADIFCINK